MHHKHSNWPFFLILFLTLFSYFTFEVVAPFAKEQEHRVARCEQAGGIMIKLNHEDTCIRKDFIIEKY